MHLITVSSTTEINTYKTEIFVNLYITPVFLILCACKFQQTFTAYILNEKAYKRVIHKHIPLHLMDILSVYEHTTLNNARSINVVY